MYVLLCVFLFIYIMLMIEVNLEIKEECNSFFFILLWHEVVAQMTNINKNFVFRVCKLLRSCVQKKSLTYMLICAGGSLSWFSQGVLKASKVSQFWQIFDKTYVMGARNVIIILFLYCVLLYCSITFPLS